LTLLEVIVAMAIFLVALAAIGQLIQFGMMRALDAEYQSQALQKAQSKMAEVIAGAEPLGSQTDSPFPDDPDGVWHWSIDAAQEDFANAWRVKITVSRPVDDGKIEVSLSQIILDPAVRVAPAMTAPSTASGGTTTGN